MKQAIGAVSAGHPATAGAAARVLKDGGNAFDAVVAAHMTACVAEPVLASFAGGGFLLAETGSGKQTLYDFFVQTPLKTRKEKELTFFPITADFGYALQEFHIGPGSVATPGTVKGLFSIHNDLCSLPFSRLAEPAIELAKKGLRMNSFQAEAFGIVKPIYLSNSEATGIFKSIKKKGELVKEGEWLKQPYLAEFLEQLVRDGEQFFYEGEIADKIRTICKEEGGHLTQKDFKNYRVEKRRPLQLSYRDTSLSINPPPSSGGLLIAFGLKLMETIERGSFEFQSGDYLDLLACVQDLTNKARIENLIENREPKRVEGLLHAPFIELYKRQVKNRFHTSRGTTQISVMDSDGNMAGLTTSNGSGSGVMIPGTGIMLNNMLGEKDLNPAGFYMWPENERISSMMAPVILRFADGKRVVLGSGGSNRIRTAILQVVLNLVDRGMDLKGAVQSPRIHYEDGFLNLEAGFSLTVIQHLTKKYSEYKTWKGQHLFFGGTHAVSGEGNQFSGAGDPRRGGVSVIVKKK